MTKTKTVGLLGSTGRVGGWVLEMSLFKGLEVVALVRSPQKLKDYDQRSNLTLVKGDATSADDLKAMLNAKKIDVIVSTLGSPNNDNVIMKKAADALVDALSSTRENVPRIVWMTSTGVNEATNQAKSYVLFGKPSRWFFGYGAFGWLQFKLLIPYVIGQNLWDDMGRSEDVVREAPDRVSSATVIVRPGNMWPVSEHPTFSDKWRAEGGDDASYELVDADDPPPGKWIGRRAIATALLDLIDVDSYDGKAKSLFQRG